jgi:hypothetical protein
MQPCGWILTFETPACSTLWAEVCPSTIRRSCWSRSNPRDSKWPALLSPPGLIFTHKSRGIRWGMGIINSLLLIVYGVIPYVFMFECARVLLLS